MDRFNNYVNIDLDAIYHNFQAISEKAGVTVMAVVKADAYGHGAVPVARHLESYCAFFGVSSLCSRTPKSVKHRNSGQVQSVPSVCLKGTNSSFAENNIFIAACHNVLCAHKKLLQGICKTPFEKNGFVCSTKLLKKLKILHISCAYLNYIDIGKHIRRADS